MAPALEAFESDLGEPPFAIHRIHHLQLIRVARRAALDEAADSHRFRLQPEIAQRVYGEYGIANPTVAVIPVTLTANVLGEGGRGGRDDGSGRGVCEGFQYDCRAFDPDARPVSVRDLRCPLLPPIARLLELGAQALRGVVPHAYRLVPLGVVVLQSEMARLACAQVQLPSQVMALLDFQGHVAVDQQARIAPAGEQGVLAYRADPGFDFAEIQARNDVDAEVHRAAHAAKDPDELPARALSPSGAHGEEIDELGFVAP